MARTGLSKEEVAQARTALLAQGQYPSVDAVRVALGNTGSKTTIHKYLKELDEEQGSGGPAIARPATISGALHDLVERLAARLRQESEDQLDTARAELADKEQQLAQANRQLESELRTTREHEARLQTELRQQRLAFNVKQDELAHTQQSLYEQLTNARKLEQKVDQLQAQQRHAGDLERQLATSMAHNERLGEQVQALNAALAPAQARARELELLLAQVEARAQAQEQMGEQLRAYLDRIAVPK